MGCRIDRTRYRCVPLVPINLNCCHPGQASTNDDRGGMSGLYHRSRETEGNCLTDRVTTAKPEHLILYVQRVTCSPSFVSFSTTSLGQQGAANLGATNPKISELSSAWFLLTCCCSAHSAPVTVVAGGLRTDDVFLAPIANEKKCVGVQARAAVVATTIWDFPEQQQRKVQLGGSMG